MSKKHPVIAITGSSGAGTSIVKNAFRHIFRRLNVTPIIIEGDSFHRYDRVEMKRVMAKEEARGNKYFSHFGPEANHFDKIEKTFKAYGEKGACWRRYYLHNEEEAEPFGQKLG
jgi:phosphoribulokinase